MCQQVERRFICRPESSREARRFLAASVAEWSGGGGAGGSPALPLLDALLLVVDELSANACKADSPDFCLVVTAHHAYVEVKVADSDPQPARRLEPGPDATHGRGLAIVEALSTAWGQRPFDGERKEVWAQVAVPATTLVALECTL